MLKNYIFFLSLFLLSNSIKSQVFICTSDSRVFEILPDNSVTEILNLENETSSLYDIAVSPNRDFFFVSNQSILSVNSTDSTTSFLITLPDGNYTSLVYADNALFTLNNTTNILYKYDLNEENLIELGNTNHSTPGDLTFYKGNIIFPDYPNIIAFNLTTNSISEFNCLSNEFNNCWGIANNSSDCISNEVYMTDAYDIWKVDLETGEKNRIITNDAYDNKAVYGLCALNEDISSQCESIELEPQNCSLSTQDVSLGNNYLKVYPNPFVEEINIEDTHKIKKIEVYDLTGKLVFKFDEINNKNKLPIESGVYLLNIYLKNNSKLIRKIVKK